MRRLPTIALVAVVLALPTAAAQASGLDVLQDCADDEQLSKVYTQAEYQAALQQIPADSDEYTGCRDIIRRAQLAAAAGDTGAATGGGTGAGGGTGGSTGPPGSSPLDTASPADRAAAGAAAARGSAPLSVGGEMVTPGDPGTIIAGPQDLPAPLLVVLVVLAAAAIAAITRFVMLRVRRRPA